MEKKMIHAHELQQSLKTVFADAIRIYRRNKHVKTSKQTKTKQANKQNTVLIFIVKTEEETDT